MFPCRRWHCIFGRSTRHSDDCFEPTASGCTSLRPSFKSSNTVTSTGGNSLLDGSSGGYLSTSTWVPSAASSFQSARTTAEETVEFPPFVLFVAEEVGKLMDFGLVEKSNHVPEQDIPLFPGQLWAWAEEAAKKYWMMHAHMQSFYSFDSDPSVSVNGTEHMTDDDDSPTVKEAKSHYRNVVMFEYDILGGNDPAWASEAWEHSRVMDFIDSLMKPFLKSTDAESEAPVFDGPGLSGPEKAAARSRVQHVFALGVVVHRLRWEKSLGSLMSENGPKEQVLDIDQLIADSRAKSTSRRRARNLLDSPQCLLEMQRQHWLTTAHTLSTQFKIYPQLSSGLSTDPSHDELPGVHQSIMELLVAQLTAMALEEESVEALFELIDARFGKTCASNTEGNASSSVIRTFPSRVLWEFARRIGRRHCERMVDCKYSQAVILNLLKNHEDIMFDLEDVIFCQDNIPALRYFYCHVLGKSLTGDEAEDQVLLQERLVSNSALSRTIAIGVALEIMRKSRETNIEQSIRPWMRGVDMQHAMFNQAVSDKPFDSEGHLMC